MCAQPLNSSYCNANEWTFHNLNDEQAKEVAEKLKTSSTLQSLSIIGPFARNAVSLKLEGAIAILKAVKEHSSLTSLNLEGNNDIGDDIAPAIFNMLLKNRSLTNLNLRDCGLSNMSVGLIVEGIKRNKTLEILEVDTNSINNQGFEQIRSAAKARQIPLKLDW
jgi:Ran GTPase-activating protein (RanGAP) involved in mRNA processing and transport